MKQMLKLFILITAIGPFSGCSEVRPVGPPDTDSDTNSDNSEGPPTEVNVSDLSRYRGRC